MPGSPEILEDFIATLEPKETRSILGELLKTVFDKMQLAGEAGSLLKIEEEITSAIDTARQEWRKQQNDLLTLREESKEEFFNTAEQQLINALQSYAEQADANSYQRRLFADDAARGFAFIDLCRKQYDAVVMNPPFGKTTTLHAKKGKVKRDLFVEFYERGWESLFTSGMIGIISSRAWISLSSLSKWRSSVLNRCGELTVADLGANVLDDANVYAAAFFALKQS
jgi:hypothetical protein